jgi:hypothetical protein
LVAPSLDHDELEEIDERREKDEDDADADVGELVGSEDLLESEGPLTTCAWLIRC